MRFPTQDESDFRRVITAKCNDENKLATRKRAKECLQACQKTAKKTDGESSEASTPLEIEKGKQQEDEDNDFFN